MEEGGAKTPDDQGHEGVAAGLIKANVKLNYKTKGTKSFLRS